MVVFYNKQQKHRIKKETKEHMRQGSVGYPGEKKTGSAVAISSHRLQMLGSFFLTTNVVYI